MSIIDALSLYVKNYLTSNEFEQWVYENEEKLSDLYYDNLYYEIISTNYNNKEQIINLKTKLKNFLNDNYTSEFNNINNCYIDKIINSVETENSIMKLLKQRYGRKEKVEFDCLNINSLKELHQNIKGNFEFSQYYGMNWAALRDFLKETELPEQIIFHGWTHLVEIMPKDSNILRDILREYVSNGSEVIYK